MQGKNALAILKYRCLSTGNFLSYYARTSPILNSPILNNIDLNEFLIESSNYCHHNNTNIIYANSKNLEGFTMPQTFTIAYFTDGNMQNITILVKEWNKALSETDKKMIVATIMGEKNLHQTKKSRGCPINAIGYLHNNSENTIYAVSEMKQTPPYSISIIKSGEVKEGKHIFK